MKVRTGGITDISTTDYPNLVSSVLYLCGCPLRCPFCQNPSLLTGEDCQEVETGEVVGRILENLPLTDGVCITGGEPTLQLEATKEICRGLKKRGLKVKLDTNGYYPERVEALVGEGLVDYMAMDIKAPLEKGRYREVSGTSGDDVVERVTQSMEAIVQGGFPFELRTTIVPTLIHEKSDVLKIARALRSLGVTSYVLQQFRPEGGCLDPEFEGYAAPPRGYLLDLARAVKDLVPNVKIRTMENGEEAV